MKNVQLVNRPAMVACLTHERYTLCESFTLSLITSEKGTVMYDCYECDNVHTIDVNVSRAVYGKSICSICGENASRTELMMYQHSNAQNKGLVPGLGAIRICDNCNSIIG
jgi:hypothetical protein